MLKHRLLPLVSLLLCATGALAEEEGHVQLPRPEYDRLIQAGQIAQPTPRPAPAGYTLGRSKATVTVEEEGSRVFAKAQIELSLKVFENEWTLIPILPAGTAVDSVMVGGLQVALITTPQGLAWAARKEGTYILRLEYRKDVSLSQHGYSLALPLPEAIASTLALTLPGKNLEASLIPAVGTTSSTRGEVTRIEATLPATAAVHISWLRPRGEEDHSISRALYQGKLEGDAVAWSGELDVELRESLAILALTPTSLPLTQVEIDGEEVPILVRDGHFAVVATGRGRHRLRLGFETLVQHGDGPARVELQIPEVPISRFELTLPGDQEVTVIPAAKIRRQYREGKTLVSLASPLGAALTLSWTEALPGDSKLQANASVYHAMHAAEGVLFVRALVRYEVRRGSTRHLRLVLPTGAQVDRITDPQGAVSDWRIDQAQGDQPRVLTVYLDREIDRELLLDLTFDLPMPTTEDLPAPLLSALDMQRQRGMVALLSSRDLTLEAQENSGLTRVGENQLPLFLREKLEQTVAHTFKYNQQPPPVLLTAVAAEAQAGRFDVQVNTLISLGEVSLKGIASVDVEVKAGSLTELQLILPEDVHLLGLASPSLRTYEVAERDGEQVIEVFFTQEMEGEFRLELSYESILQEETSDSAGLPVPLLAVPGAEVEQGRLAVEASSAVELATKTAHGLTSTDIDELPKQLLLQTRHPILQAYKYVRSQSSLDLRLAVTRHRLLEVRQAAIDQADYRTLYTRDGLAVTTARFTVRNSRKQFLRLRLPEGSELWSASVDGQPEKPAEGQGQEATDEILIKLRHSTQEFFVEIVYSTPHRAFAGHGRVFGTLPHPDILVTQSRWQVLLPSDLEYRAPKSNMSLVAGPEPVGEAALESAADRMLSPEQATLRLNVPNTGLRYTFEKLYANQGGEPGSGPLLPWSRARGSAAYFEMRYTSPRRGNAALLLSLLGALLFWLGLAAFFIRLFPRWALPGVLIGGLLLVLTLGLQHVPSWPATLLSIVLLAASMITRIRRGRPA